MPYRWPRLNNIRDAQLSTDGCEDWLRVGGDLGEGWRWC
jgi:hypothetical protein